MVLNIGMPFCTVYLHEEVLLSLMSIKIKVPSNSKKCYIFLILHYQAFIQDLTLSIKLSVSDYSDYPLVVIIEPRCSN